MPIDVTKLTNTVRKDGKTVARCPACAAQGGDATGNNLVVFADGKFGCVAFPKDKGHNRLIFQLVGVPNAEPEIYRVPVRRVTHAPPKILRIVGRLGRGMTTAPATEAVKTASTQAERSEIKDAPALTKTRPPVPPEHPIENVALAPADVPTMRPDLNEGYEELLDCGVGTHTLSG
jgi:hypothetical protein